MNKAQIFDNSLTNNFNNSTENNLFSNTTLEKQTRFIAEYFHYIWIIFLLIHVVFFVYMVIKLNFCKKDLLQEVGENSQERRKINEECAICMENIENEVQLICSHSFCAHCMINYGKHTFNMVNIICPMCRQKSKILIANFERNESNKEFYDLILNYNHEFTQYNYTSLCFCVDFVKLFFFYIKQIANFNNPRYRAQRACVILFLLVVFVYLIVIYMHDLKNTFEIVEDIFYYCCLIFVIAEYFYRNFRNRTNNEFEIYNVNNIENNNLSNINEENTEEIQV
jgi:hypothetical protein